MRTINHFPLRRVNGADGLVAIGGNLGIDLVLSSYCEGVFPWFNSDFSPVLWYNPDPRFVLFPNQLHISKKFCSFLKKSLPWSLKFDHNFEAMIKLCASCPRKNQIGTWITTNMKKVYIELHKLGLAHSCEVYKNSCLIGGFYGICLGKIFFGESMVSLEPQVSKYAFTKFVQYFQNKGLQIIDCQQETKHLLNMGAININREHFLNIVKRWIFPNSWQGNWGEIFCDFC